MTNEELLTYLFAEPSHILVQPMATWLTSSRRFTTFVLTFRSKIRKKLRATHDEASLRDLQLELATAYRLVQERTLSLVYEPPVSHQARGPDFAVTFTTKMTFMVEVTRLRDTVTEQPAESHEPWHPRLADAVCSKLGQLMPQCSNVLLIGMDTLPLTHTSIHASMSHIQQRAERNDISFFQRYRFRDRAAFFQAYQRLSEILVCEIRDSCRTSLVCWINPRAKYPLPSKVQTVLQRSHTG